MRPQQWGIQCQLQLASLSGAVNGQNPACLGLLRIEGAAGDQDLFPSCPASKHSGISLNRDCDVAWGGWGSEACPAFGDTLAIQR
jgi:hypothetical protein